MVSETAYRSVANDLHAHEAVLAWRSLGQGSDGLRAVEPLKVRKMRSAKSAVYRLDGVGPDGEAVVAKRCRRNTAASEQTIYERILPRLGVPFPQYYGCTDDAEPNFCWLFLQYIDGEPLSTDRGDHRRLASDWLVRLHTAAVGTPELADLPDRGPRHYLDQLRSAFALLDASLRDERFRSDWDLLRNLFDACQVVEAGWERVAQPCAALPLTLVHGDFVAKNVRVSAQHGRIELLPFDWETGGTGVPTADLTSVERRRYWEQVVGGWGHLSQRDIDELATVGVLFRTIVSVYWASLSLPYGWAPKPVSQLRLYDAWLAEAIRAIGLDY